MFIYQPFHQPLQCAFITINMENVVMRSYSSIAKTGNKFYGPADILLFRNICLRKMNKMQMLFVQIAFELYLNFFICHNVEQNELSKEFFQACISEVNFLKRNFWITHNSLHSSEFI